MITPHPRVNEAGEGANIGLIMEFYMFTEVLIALLLFSMSLLGGGIIALQCLEEANQSLQHCKALIQHASQ
jgi:hypothetical protein